MEIKIVDTKKHIFYSDGRVFSKKLKRDVGSENHDGYIGKNHRKIYEAFNGKIPDGFEIDHIDGNRKNNSLENLEIVTHQENIKRAAMRGSYKNNPLRSGQNHGRSILDDMIVLTLRTLPKKSKNGRGDGFSNTELSKTYKVSVSRICNTRNNMEWKHIPSLKD